MSSNCSAGEDSWESLGQQRDPISQSKSTLNIHWKEWIFLHSFSIPSACWSWSSSILVIWYLWCEQLTHWKSPWRWERLRAEEEGIRAWDGWMASLMQWTWIWDKLQEMVRDREAWHAAVHVVAKRLGPIPHRYMWATEQQWKDQMLVKSSKWASKVK